jgi:hypothetical protein
VTSNNYSLLLTHKPIRKQNAKEYTYDGIELITSISIACPVCFMLLCELHMYVALVAR